MHPQRPRIAENLRPWSFGLSVLAVIAAWTITAAAQEQRTVVPVMAPPEIAKTADKVVETLGIGERLILRSESGKKITEVVVSKPDVLDFKQVENQPNVITVVGKKIGTARVTIADEANKEKVVTVKVVRPPTDLQRLVKQQFPKAAVKVEGAEGAVMVTGVVDSTEDVGPIISFVEGASGGSVYNAIRVSGVMQVELEVCIAQVLRSEFRKLGFNWLHSDEHTVTGSTIGELIPTSRPVGTANLQIDGSGLGTNGLFSAVPTADTNFTFGVFDPNSAFFGYLSALRTEGLAKLLANPKLVALNGKEASFRVGGTLLIQLLGNFTNTLERVPFGTELVFIPTILGDGKIRLEVKPSVTTAEGTTRLKEEKFSTTIELESGQTFAIGGLLQTEVQARTVKMPVLGDLPFAGTLFRSVQYEEVEQELLVLVTPKLVDPLDCSQRTTKLPGQETRTPTDFELFLEGILEAPRGPREICVDGCYKPAHWPCFDESCPNGECVSARLSAPVAPVMPAKAAPTVISEPRLRPVSPALLIEGAESESPEYTTPRR